MTSMACVALKTLFRIRKLVMSFDSAEPNYQKMRLLNYTERDVLKRYGDQVKVEKCGDRLVYTFKPENIKNKTVVWFHGGGYIRGPVKQHFDRWIQVCNETQSYGILPDYPKAPEFDHKDTKVFLDLFYKKYLSTKQEPYYLIGDSAGGGLALSFAFDLQKKALQAPQEVFLFSPWLDLSFSQSDIKDYAEKEILLNQRYLETFAQWYAGDQDLKNEFISPLFSTEKKPLFPIHIYSTEDELLHSAVVEFKNKYPQTFVYNYKKLFHDWPVMPLPEAKKVINEVISAIYCSAAKSMNS